MKRNLIIVFALFMLIGISIAGLTGGINPINSEKVVADKIIDDVKYEEIKSVFVKEDVVIDDKVGLDIKWVEISCVDLLDDKEVIVGSNCSYELYKENLFHGATITVNYSIDSKTEEKQVLLNNAIEKKVNEVKTVWAERQAQKTLEKSLEEKTEGTTNIISDKKTTEQPKEPTKQ